MVKGSRSALMQSLTGTIGTVARQAVVNVETVRYYQRIDLVREPARPQGGVRRYPADTVERIRFGNDRRIYQRLGLRIRVARVSSNFASASRPVLR